MKKLIAICVAALTTGAFADDSYLYWMIDDSITWEEGTTTTPSYDAARIGVTGSDGTIYLSLYNENGNGVGGTGTTISLGETAFPMYAYAGIASTYQTTGYSFFIELLNDGKAVGRSNSSSSLDWSALASYTTSTLGNTSVPANSPWNGGTFTTAVIPEPTSGLLMLFGLSALALRRKRQVKA